MNKEVIPPRPLERLFHSLSARVLDFLILNQRFDYSHSDISNLAKIPPRSLQRILPTLIEEKLIIRTRKSGKAYMYIFNRNSEKGKALQKYFEETIKSDIDNISNSNTDTILDTYQEQEENLIENVVKKDNKLLHSNVNEIVDKALTVTALSNNGVTDDAKE